MQEDGDAAQSPGAGTSAFSELPSLLFCHIRPRHSELSRSGCVRGRLTNVGGVGRADVGSGSVRRRALLDAPRKLRRQVARRPEAWAHQSGLRPRPERGLIVVPR